MNSTRASGSRLETHGLRFLLLAQLAQWPGMLAQDGVIVCQHSRHEDLGGNIGPLGRMRRARFGETILDFYQSGGKEIGRSSLSGDF